MQALIRPEFVEDFDRQPEIATILNTMCGSYYIYLILYCNKMKVNRNDNDNARIIYIYIYTAIIH